MRELGVIPPKLKHLPSKFYVLGDQPELYFRLNFEQLYRIVISCNFCADQQFPS